MSELSNGDWYKEQLIAARSSERLDYLCEAIKYDQWEDEPYTKDVDLMNELRAIRDGKLAELDAPPTKRV